MDRFIDEQDPSRDRSSSPNFYSLMFGGTDGRKGLSLYPGVGKSHLHQHDSNGAPTAGDTADPVSVTSPVLCPSNNLLSVSASSTNGRLTTDKNESDSPSEQPPSSQ